MLYHYKNLTANSIKVPLANGSVAILGGHAEMEHSFPLAPSSDLLTTKVLRQLHPKPKAVAKQAVPWEAPAPIVHEPQDDEVDEAADEPEE